MRSQDHGAGIRSSLGLVGVAHGRADEHMSAGMDCNPPSKGGIYSAGDAADLRGEVTMGSFLSFVGGTPMVGVPHFPALSVENSIYLIQNCRYDTKRETG